MTSVTVRRCRQQTAERSEHQIHMRPRQTFRYSFHLSIPFSDRSLLAKGASYAASMQENGVIGHTALVIGFDCEAVVCFCEMCVKVMK